MEPFPIIRQKPWIGKISTNSEIIPNCEIA
jgi:hypothetical protein